MVRQLATSEYKTADPVKNNNVLIIGDPNLNGFTRANQLPGAAQEAKTVYEKLKGIKQLNIEAPIINGSSDEILTTLFKQDYKIIHLAAHGFFNETAPASSGVLIGKIKDTDEPLFLTPHHINQLPSTPEFVFINCCFLGRVNPYAEALSANRFKLAANIGTQLIENGVKAVVVTGWEVDDAAALAFAEIFYERMLEGYNFGIAVLEARKYIYNKFPYTNTWGAFQCYGQQHYTFNVQTSSATIAKTYNISQEAENDIDNLLSKTEVAFYEPDGLLKELRTISKAIDDAKLLNPELKQKEAQAYMELSDFTTSCKLYNDLFKTENASFDVKALENYQNIIVNKTIADYFSLSSPNAATVTEMSGLIDKSIGNLNYLLEIWKTGARYALIASAYKRKAFILPYTTDDEEAHKLSTMEIAASHYKTAYEKINNSYTFCNWIVMKSLIDKKTNSTGKAQTASQSKSNSSITAPQIAKTLQELEKRARDSDADLTYWKFSELSDVSLCRYFQKPTDANFNAMKEAFESTWKMMVSQNKKQRQIDNLRILAHFAGFAGMDTVKKKLDAFLKTI